MKKVRIIIFMLFIFMMTGCGAKVNHTMDINTDENTVEISTKIEINESDYQHINGGRERLITIINENKPEDLSFSIDEQNQNIFNFMLSFDSYKEYMSKYESITGTKSISVFDIQDFSKDSPFISSKNIEINDDLSKLLEWLKTALLHTGAISSDQKDNLIQQQVYEYTFNKETQGLYSKRNIYSEEMGVNIYKTDLNLVVNKNNIIDLNIVFFIEKEEANNFTDNFSNYLKEMDVTYTYKNDIVELDDKAYMKYDVSMLDMDVSNKDAVEQMNTIFGKNFVMMTSEITEDDSFFKQDVHQTLNIQLQFNNLFERQQIDPTTITVDLNKLDVDEKKMNDTEFPLTTTLDGSSYQLTVNATYSNIHYYTIAIIVIIILTILFLLKKFVLKSKKVTFKSTIIQMDSYFTKLLQDKFLEKEFTIIDNVIEGKTFILQISNINKIDYGQKFSIGILLYIIAMIVGGWYILRLLSYGTIAGLLLIIGIIVLLGYIKISKMRVIYIKLVSGKAYSFFFEKEDTAKEIYLQIIAKIEEQENSADEIGAILESIEGKESAKI